MRLSKIKKEQLKRMVIFFIAALFLLIILLNFLFLAPKILASRAHEKNLRSQIDNFAIRLSTVNKLNKEELQKELDLLNKKFPRKEEIPTILDELEQLGKDVGVNITSIAQQKLGKNIVVNVNIGGGLYKPTYQILPIAINLNCSYIKLAEFLSALDTWYRGVVIIKGFDIEKDEVVPDKIKVENLILEIPMADDSDKQ